MKLKTRSLTPMHKQVRNWTLTTLVGLATLSPLALIKQSQFSDVATLSYQKLLNEIDRQQNAQQVNTYGFWNDDPKLDLFYGQDGNISANPLTKVNRQTFAYQSEATDATLDLANINLPSLRIAKDLGFQPGENEHKWNRNSGSPIYNPELKTSSKVIRKISDLIKITWRQAYPSIDKNYNGANPDPFYQIVDQFINQLGSSDFQTNFYQVSEFYQILGAIGATYPGRLNVQGHEGWIGEWLNYPGRDTDPNYTTIKKVNLISGIKALLVNSSLQRFFSNPDTFINKVAQENSESNRFQENFVGPLLNSIANLANSFAQGTDLKYPHVLFPFLRQSTITFNGFDPLKQSQVLDFINVNNQLNEQEKSLLAQILNTKLNQISQIIPVDWNQWVEAQSELLKDPTLIAALKKPDPTQAAKIIDKFIANFTNQQNQPLAFSTTEKRVLNQTSIDRKQEAISFIFDQLMLTKDEQLLSQYLMTLFDLNQSETGKILFEPWLASGQKALGDFLKTTHSEINYDPNQPQLLTNLWFIILASNWKTFANERQLNLISTTYVDFQIDQPVPDWKSHQTQYLAIGKMLISAFPLVNNFDALLQQGAIAYQQANHRLSIIQKTIQDQYSTSGKIEAQWQATYNQAADQVLKLENKVTILGALVNSFSQLSSKFFNNINNQKAFQTYLTIKYGFGQDLIERLSQLQVVLDERFKASRNWVFNSLLSATSKPPKLGSKNFAFNNWNNDLEWFALKPFQATQNAVFDYQYEDRFANPGLNKFANGLSPLEISQLEINLNSLFEAAKRIFFNTITLDLTNLATSQNLAKLKTLWTKVYPQDSGLVQLLDLPVNQNAFKSQILIAINNWNSFWSQQWALDHPSFNNNNFFSSANLINNSTIMTTFNLNDQFVFMQALKSFWDQIKTINPNSLDFIKLGMKIFPNFTQLQQIDHLWTKFAKDPQYLNSLHQQYQVQPISEANFANATQQMIRSALINLGLDRHNELTKTNQQNLNNLVNQIWTGFKQYPNQFNQWKQFVQLETILAPLPIDQNAWIQSLFYQLQAQANQFANQIANPNPNDHLNQDLKILQQWKVPQMLQLVDLIMVSPILAHPFSKATVTSGSAALNTYIYEQPQAIHNQFDHIGIANLDQFNRLGMNKLYGFLKSGGIQINLDLLKQNFQKTTTNSQHLAYNQTIAISPNQIELMIDWTNGGFWTQPLFNKNIKWYERSDYATQLIAIEQSHFVSTSSFIQTNQAQNPLINNLINHQNFVLNGKFLTDFKLFKTLNLTKTDYPNPFALFNPVQSEQATTNHQQAKNWIDLVQPSFNDFYQLVDLNNQPKWNNWQFDHPLIKYLNIFNNPLINLTFSQTNNTLNQLKTIIKSTNDVKEMQNLFQNNFDRLNDQVNNFRYWNRLSDQKLVSANKLFQSVSQDLLNPYNPLGLIFGETTIGFLMLMISNPSIKIGYWQQLPPNFMAVANQNAYLNGDQAATMQNQVNNPFHVQSLTNQSGVDFSTKQLMNLTTQLFNNDQFAWNQILSTNHPLATQLKTLITKNLTNIIEHQQDALIFDWANRRINNATAIRSDGLSSTKFIDLNQKFATFLTNNTSIMIESFNSLNYTNDFYDGLNLIDPVFVSGKFNNQQNYGAAGQFLKFNTADLLRGMTSTVLSIRNRKAIDDFPIDYDNKVDLNQIYTVQATNQMPESGLGGIFDDRSAAIKSFENNNKWYRMIPFFGNYIANQRRQTTGRRLKQFILNQQELPIIKALPYLPTELVQTILTDANGGPETEWQHNLLAYSTLTLQIVQLPNGNAGLKIIQDIFDNGSGAYVYLANPTDPNGQEYDQGEPLSLFGMSYVSRVLSQPSSQINGHLLKNWLDPNHGIIANLLTQSPPVSLDPDLDLGFNGIEQTKIFKESTPGDFANQAVNALVKNWNQLIKTKALNLTPEEIDYQAPWFNIDIDNRFAIIKSVLATTTISEIAITWTKVNSTNPKGALSFTFQFQIGGNVANLAGDINKTRVGQISIKDLPVEFSFSQKINELLKIINIQNLNLNTIGFNKQQIIRDFYKANLPDQALLEQDYKRALRWANDQEVLYQYVDFWIKWINQAGAIHRQFNDDQLDELQAFSQAQDQLLTIATNFTKNAESQFAIDYEQLEQANLAFKNNIQKIISDEDLAVVFLKELQTLNNQFNQNQANLKVDQAFGRSYHQNASLITTEDKLRFLANAINAGWANGTTIDQKYQSQNQQDQSTIKLDVQVSDVFSVMVNVNNSVFQNRFSPITINDQARGQVFTGKPQADGNYLWEFNATDTTNQLTFTNFTNVDGALKANEYLIKVDATKIPELKTTFEINLIQNPANYDNITIANSPSSDFLVNGPYSKDWFLASQQFELSPYNQWNADTFKKLHEQNQLELIFSDDPDQLVANYFASQGWDQNHLEVIAYESAKALDDPTRFNKYLMQNPFKIFKSNLEKQTGTIHDIISIKSPNLINNDNTVYQLVDSHYSSAITYQSINQFSPDLLIDLTWLQQAVVDLSDQFQTGDQIVWGEVDPQLKINEPIFNQNQSLVKIDFGLLKQASVQTIIVNESANLQFQFKPQTLYKLSISRKLNNDFVKFNKYVYYTTDSILNISQHNSLNKIAYLEQYFNLPSTTFNEKLQFNQFFDDGSWQMLLHNQALITNNQATIDQLEAQKYDLTLSTILAIIKNQQALLGQSGANQLDVDVIKRQIVNKIQAVAQFVQQGFGSNAFDVLLNNSFLNYLELFNDNQIKQLDADLNRILIAMNDTQAEIDKLAANKAQAMAMQRQLISLNATLNQIQLLTQASQVSHPNQVAPLPTAWYDPDDYQSDGITPKNDLVNPKSLNLWFKIIVVEKVLGLEVGPDQLLRVANQNSAWNALDQLYFEQNQRHLNIETTIKNLYLGFLELGWFKNNLFDRLSIVFKDDQAQNQFNQQWTNGISPWITIFQTVEQKTHALFNNQNPNPIVDWNLVKNNYQLPDLDVNGPNFNIQKQHNLNKFAQFQNASVQLSQLFNPDPNILNALINDQLNHQWSSTDLIKSGSPATLFNTWDRLEQLFSGLKDNRFEGFNYDPKQKEIKINQKAEDGWHFATPMLYRPDLNQPNQWTIGWKLSEKNWNIQEVNQAWSNDIVGLWIKVSTPNQIIDKWTKISDLEIKFKTNLGDLTNVNIDQDLINNKILPWLTSWFGSDQDQQNSLTTIQNNGFSTTLLSDFRPTNWSQNNYADWGGKNYFEILLSDRDWSDRLIDIIKNNLLGIDSNSNLKIDNFVINNDPNSFNSIIFNILKNINQATLNPSANNSLFKIAYNNALQAQTNFDYNQIRDLVNQNTSSNDPNRISISLNQATLLVGKQFQSINQTINQTQQQINIYQNQLAQQQQQQNDLIYEKSQILSQGSSMYLMLSTLFVTNQRVYQEWNNLLTVDLPFIDKLRKIQSTIKEQMSAFATDQQLPKMLNVVEQLIAIENDLIKLQQLKQQTFYESSLDPGVAREAALYLLKNVRDVQFADLMNKILKIANWQGNLGINLTSNLISSNALWSLEQIKDFDDNINPLSDHPGLLKTKSIQFLGSVFEANLNKRSYFILSVPLAFASDSPQAISEKFRIFFANDEYISLNGLNHWMQRVMNQPLATSLLNETKEKLFRTTNAKAHQLANGQTFIHFGYNPFDPQSKPTQANRSSLLFNQSPIYNDYFFKEKTYLATISPIQSPALAIQNQNQKILNQLGYFELQTINQFSNFDQIFDFNSQNQMQIFSKKNRFFKVATVAKTSDAFGQEQYGLLDHFQDQSFNVLKDPTNPSINASGHRPGWIYYDQVVLVDQLQPDLNTPAGQKAAILLTKPATLSTNQWISFVDNLLNRSFFVANDIISATVLPAAAKAILNPLLAGQSNLISIPMSDLKLLATALKFELKTSAIDPYLSGAANLFSDQNRVIIELAHQNGAQDLISNNKYTLLNLVVKISAKTNVPFVFSPKLILLKNAILEKNLVSQTIVKDFAKFNQRDLFSQLKGLLTNEIQDHFLTTTLKTTASNFNQQFNDLNYILETLFSQATYVNFNYKKYFDPFLDQTSQTIVPMIERVPLIISEIVANPQHQNLFATLVKHLTSDQPLANIKATLVAANIISFNQTNPQPAQFVINPSYPLSSQLNYATTDLKTISLELSFIDLKDPIKAAAKSQGLINTPLQFDGLQKYVNFHLVENQIMTTLSPTPVQFSLANLLPANALNANIHYQNQQILNALDQVGKAWQALITTTSLQYQTSDVQNQYNLTLENTNRGTTTSAKLFYNLAAEDLTLSAPLNPTTLNIDLSIYNDRLLNLNPQAMTNYLNQNVVKMLVQDYTQEHLNDVEAHLLRVEPLLDPGAALNGKWIFVTEIIQDQTSALAQFAISGLNAITMQNYHLLGTNRQFSQNQLPIQSRQAAHPNSLASPTTSYQLDISASPTSALGSQFSSNLEQNFSLSEVNQVLNDNQIPRQLNLMFPPAKPAFATSIPPWAIAIILIIVTTLSLGLGAWWWRRASHKSNRQR